MGAPPGTDLLWCLFSLLAQTEGFLISGIANLASVLIFAVKFMYPYEQITQTLLADFPSGFPNFSTFLQQKSRADF